jgi:hypothetical protein
MQTPAWPFRVFLKTSLLAGVVVILPLFTALVWEEIGYPARGALKGLGVLLLTAAGGGVLWRLIRRTGLGGGGSEPPSVREPRPPGGRPPTLRRRACG